MANVFVNDDHLKDAAKAIREVNGQTTTYKPEAFGGAIRGALSIAEISEQDALLTDIEALLGLGVDTGDGSLDNPFTAKLDTDYISIWDNDLDEQDNWVFYTFAPSVSGTYNLYGSSEGDIDYRIYDSKPDAYDDENHLHGSSGEGGFDDECELSAGTTYYIAVKQYYEEGEEDIWRITLVEESDDEGGEGGTATLTVNFTQEEEEEYYDEELGDYDWRMAYSSSPASGSYTVDGGDDVSFTSVSTLTIEGLQVGSVVRVHISSISGGYTNEYGATGEVGCSSETLCEDEGHEPREEDGNRCGEYGCSEGVMITLTATTASVTVYECYA